MDSNASPAADADLAIAVAAGDRKALAAIFDRYAPRLLAFSQSMLHHRADAEDCLQDIFILTATRISGLREPDRLRSWLFAIARHECLRRLERKSREVLVDAIGDSYQPDRAPSATFLPAEAALDNELAALLVDAIAGLADRDRLVLDLADRQGLATDEVAAALSMSPGSTYKLLTRARTTARKSIGALLVARTGRANCGELDALLGNWNGSMTPLLRKRLARHIEDCSLCQEQEKRVASPAALLGAGTAFAMPIPIGLRSNILDTAYEAQTQSVVAPPTDPWSRGWPPKSPHLAGGNVFGGSGSGGSRSGSSRRGPALVVAAAVALVLLIGSFVAIGRPTVSPEAIRGPLLATSSPTAISASVQSISQSSASVPSRSVIGEPPLTATSISGAPAAESTPPPARSTSSPRPTSSAGATTAESMPVNAPQTTIPTGPSLSTVQTSPAATAKSSTSRTSTSSPTTPTTVSSSTAATPQITRMSIECQYSKSAGAIVPVLSWATTDAHSVDLSIDNPGVVGSYGRGYPSSGRLELPPNGCDPNQGTQIYTLYAIGDAGEMARRTINWVPPAASTAVAVNPTPTSPTTTPPPR